MRSAGWPVFAATFVCLLPCSVAAQYTSNQPGSPQYQNAHNHDSGNDMSQAINATLVNDCVPFNGTATNQGCAVKAGYPGLQVWSINPFPTTPNGGDVDLCSAGVTDIRASTTIILTDGLHLHGCGETTPAEGGVRETFPGT
jgi:hypothetical protein